ncbi:hypothetical protein B9G54_02000 [Alloscardovia macacae]|uniref:SAF domain-containing protein n=2 Tax=Alloscardovia macacae TaxID=1160091 RepID=A0A1Y2SYV0_9BIFI|nr:hypothetical protein B9G54_02000 [Alloscardovia macacae]OTA29318.1 hypothetical protein B9T39_04190 [Alloscardovia macacae]
MFFSTASKRRRFHGIFMALILFSFCIGGLFVLCRSVQPAQSHVAVSLTRTIVRGNALTENDVAYQHIPASMASLSFVTAKEDVIGKISPVTLHEGTLIPQDVFTDVPQVPEGYTTIDVVLGSSIRQLSIGDAVSLIADESVLSHSARVLHLPAEDSQHRQLWETDSSARSPVTLALPVDDALKVLTVQAGSPIIAVSMPQSAPPPDSSTHEASATNESGSPD